MSLAPRLPVLVLVLASLLAPGQGAVTWQGPDNSEYRDLLHHLAHYGEGDPSTQTGHLEAGQLELEAGQLGAGPVSLLGAVAGLVSSHTDRQASLPAVNR